MKRLANASKRVLDLCVSAVALVIVSPVFVLTFLTVRIWLGTPVFFYQERPGMNGRLFTILKFKTMTDEHNATGALLPDADRLHGVGRLLRATSLDELPQFINVLRGEMSLVGPRPLLAEYVARYSPAQARRLLVKPGLTGWAQVNGRNAIEWEEKFALDVWYVDNWSFWLDVKILLLTIPKALAAREISNRNHVSMPEFNPERAVRD